MEKEFPKIAINKGHKYLPNSNPSVLILEITVSIDEFDFNISIMMSQFHTANKRKQAF